MALFSASSGQIPNTYMGAGFRTYSTNSDSCNAVCIIPNDIVKRFTQIKVTNGANASYYKNEPYTVRGIDANGNIGTSSTVTSGNTISIPSLSNGYDLMIYRGFNNGYDYDRVTFTAELS